MSKRTGDQAALFGVRSASRPTHCKRGHRRSPDNVSANGTCRECSRTFARESYEKSRPEPCPARTYELACARPTRKNPGGRTGTYAGWNAHLQAREPVCAACDEARRTYSSTRADGFRKPRVPACQRPSPRHPEGRTGTFAGYMAHVRTGDAICEPCEVANRERGALLAADRDATRVCAQRTAKYPDGRTGTTAGYGAHSRAGELACSPCLEANRLASVAKKLPADKRAQRKAEYENNSLAYAFRRLYYKHKMTAEQYEEMFAAQGGGCAICGTTQAGGRSKHLFHVDHDHACCPGQYSCPKCWRGLLCAGCNVGLGVFEDKPDRLVVAADYLRSRKRRSDATTPAQAGDAA